jgi:hypothetical protein
MSPCCGETFHGLSVPLGMSRIRPEWLFPEATAKGLVAGDSEEDDEKEEDDKEEEEEDEEEGYSE